MSSATFPSSTPSTTPPPTASSSTPSTASTTPTSTTASPSSSSPTSTIASTTPTTSSSTTSSSTTTSTTSSLTTSTTSTSTTQISSTTSSTSTTSSADPTTTTTTTTTSTDPTTSSTSTTETTSTTTTSSSSTSLPPPPTTSSQPPPPPSTTTTTTTSISATRDPPPPPQTISSTLTTTFQNTVFVTTTNNQGATITSAPAAITTVLTSTLNDGATTTITAVGINPTLSQNNDSSKGAAFFRNTGAVTGVFVVVGLAAASILLGILFTIHRRRRNQKLEIDSAVSASLAAAGYNRAPLDDDDNRHVDSRSRGSRLGSPDIEMGQRTSSAYALGTNSVLSGGRKSAYFASPNHDENDPHEEFNPYTEYAIPPGAKDGYVAANTAESPTAAHQNHPYRDSGGDGAVDHTIRHSASHSAGSYEPLLASFYRQTSSPTLPISNPTPPTPPPRNPQRLSDVGRSPRPDVVLLIPDSDQAKNTAQAPAAPPMISTADERLDPGLRHRPTDARTLKDNEDYSRPVLGVRNLPDGVSPASQE